MITHTGIIGSDVSPRALLLGNRLYLALESSLEVLGQEQLGVRRSLPAA